MNKETKTRFDAMSRYGCIVCRIQHGVVTQANIHHLTGSKYRSTGKKASDDHVIPLCYHHHQGQFGIHHLGTRKWEEMFGTQELLMEIVIKELGELH